MPPKSETSDELCTKAQSYVMRGGVTARTAIKAFNVKDEADIRLIRTLAATRDIGKGMASTMAIQLNDVADENDRSKLRMSAARRAIRKGEIARNVLQIHAIIHGNQRAEICKAAFIREMGSGRSAIEAAQHHGLPQMGYLFSQMALVGAELDLKRRTTADEALDRNGVVSERDARKIFRCDYQQRKKAFFKNWLENMRAEQRADNEESTGIRKREKHFQPVDYQPQAAFVDLDRIGAAPLLTEGKSGPEIVAALKVTQPSHVAEIKWRCAKRDFAGENISGTLAGKQTSALYALRRNSVQDRDHAEYLFREEVERMTDGKLQQWVAVRAIPKIHLAEATQQGKKRTAGEPLEPAKRLHRTGTSIGRPVANAVQTDNGTIIPHQNERSARSNTAVPINERSNVVVSAAALDPRNREASNVRGS